jgi:hypothetical protein
LRGMNLHVPVWSMSSTAQALGLWVDILLTWLGHEWGDLWCVFLLPVKCMCSTSNKRCYTCLNANIILYCNFVCQRILTTEHASVNNFYTPNFN